MNKPKKANLFAIMWGQLWIFFITAVVTMLFDTQFIVIQRYNRPRIVNILEQKARMKKAVSVG